MNSTGYDSGSWTDSAGDINGDGIDDLVVTTYGTDDTGNYTGATYIVFGNADGTVPDVATLDGANGFKLAGGPGVDDSSISVTPAADLNGDGIADLVVNTYGTDADGNYAGATYVVYGSTHGSSAVVDVSTLDGGNGFKLTDSSVSDGSVSVSVEGDLNGDGIADLVVNSYGTDADGNYTGATYIVFGSADGAPATVDVSTLDGGNGFKLTDSSVSDASVSVSVEGDLNGDGIADLVVNSYGTDADGNYTGATYVVFGSAAGSPATVDVAALDGGNGFKLTGGDGFGDGSVSAYAAGDVNGDGIADLIVSAYGTDAQGNFAGATYVVYGSAGGFSATVDVSALDGSQGFQVVGSAYQDGSVSVSADGDVNGDGIADLLVSVYGTGSDGVYGGASYVVYGRAGGFGGTLDVSALGENDGYEVSNWSSNDNGGGDGGGDGGVIPIDVVGGGVETFGAASPGERNLDSAGAASHAALAFAAVDHVSHWLDVRFEYADALTCLA